MLVGTLRRAINKHHHQTRTLSQRSSAKCCGDTNTYVYTNDKNLIGDSQVDTQQSTKQYSTRDMSLRASNVRIHNTVAHATLVNNSKVNSTIEYIHACMRCPWKRRGARDGQYTQIFGRATKASTIRPRQYKHDSIESSSCKSQQGGGNKSQIYPLTVKEIADAYHAHATLKHFFKCNAILDKSYNFKLLKTKMQ